MKAEGGSVDGRRTAAQYDAMAEVYDRHVGTSAFNAYYERPATMAMVGDVAGLRVLEIGCGSGLLTKWLADHGALVTAVDVSPAMLSLAKNRLPSRVRLVLADLGAGLGFIADHTFDLVVASLVLHYLRDWEAILAEIDRVLTGSGRFVFSTHHPTMDARNHSPDDYFAVEEVTEEWLGAQFPVSFWRRPLVAMTQAIAAAGFVITRLVEPLPSPVLEEVDPPAYQRLRTQPAFLLFELRPGPRER